MRSCAANIIVIGHPRINISWSWYRC